MCIILLWRQHHNELCGKFKFILAANRDEFFRRPAKPAQFLKANKDVIAGQDMAKGFEGGIWIGVNKKLGKIGAITSVRSFNRPLVTSRSGRGELLCKYLFTNENASQYLKNFSPYATMYRPFNLLVGDLMGDLFCLQSKIETKVSVLEKGFFCLGTNPPALKTKKKEHALKIFIDALHRIDEYGYQEKYIYEVLQNKKINYPEANIPGELDFLTSVFIELSDVSPVCGTRTHTIITVDKDDHVTFIEKTKLQPSDQPEQWLRNKYEFDLK